MKLCLLVSATITSVTTYPGMGKVMDDLYYYNQSRADRAPVIFLGSTKLLGDISTCPTALTPVESIPVHDTPGSLGSIVCAADACRVYKYAMLNMASASKDPSTGDCSSLARGAIRLGFHDAGASDLNAGYGGSGVDGSIL
ncbi:ligninase h2 precursor [Ophiostoma piceae UAMH 11346]|uniref:Ligninase h2 n=1 Tax=Ophiostoma piceae (strain UAMH 11346) TaxID=1262450 RepID=S3BR01_OPHP1|nr:ligninase h2 precursor [Ophiostoma piceae UAMH 11346]